MAAAYDDKTLLFITSTDGRVPQGRNARAKHRTKTAKRRSAANGGSFATLSLTTVDEEPKGPVSKGQARRRDSPSPVSLNAICADTANRAIFRSQNTCPSMRAIDNGWSLPFINPAEILSVATFHIRRMAAMSMDSAPDGIATLLRRRQWSCVPFAFNCFGKDPCVDSAVLCVADRIRFLSGSPSSPLVMMKHYDQALRNLQVALDKPEEHHPQDILAAVQMLAVYEMLDPSENESWSKHIAGAGMVIKTHTSITPEARAKWESRGCGCALPMFGDALMTNDTAFFRTYPWRELLWAVFDQVPDPPEGIRDLMQCLRLMPSLLLDVDRALSRGGNATVKARCALLDRAHDLRYRTKSALSGNQLYTSCNYRELLSTFDLLGTIISGLLAMDRVIAALTPPQVLANCGQTDETEELCAQLLQLELGAMMQYPSLEVLAGFQHIGSFVARPNT